MALPIRQLMHGELEILVDELSVKALEIGVRRIARPASPGQSRRAAASRDMPSGMTLVPYCRLPRRRSAGLPVSAGRRAASWDRVQHADQGSGDARLGEEFGIASKIEGSSWSKPTIMPHQTSMPCC